MAKNKKIEKPFGIRRLPNKMFTCLVDQINDVADRAHAYSKKKGA